MVPQKNTRWEFRDISTWNPHISYNLAIFLNFVAPPSGQGWNGVKHYTTYGHKTSPAFQWYHKFKNPRWEFGDFSTWTSHVSCDFAILLKFVAPPSGHIWNCEILHHIWTLDLSSFPMIPQIQKSTVEIWRFFNLNFTRIMRFCYFAQVRCAS